jgi:branched-chain amino acid aminotransferase
MAMESKFTWLNGELIPSEKASVPFLTAALHYGMAAFEGIRCYDTPRQPAIFRLPEHAQRLCDSAKVLGVEMRWSAEQVAQACIDTVAANGFRGCYVRPLVYVSQGGFNLCTQNVGVSLGIAAWEWNAYLGEAALENGVRANVSSYTRHHPNVSMTKAKLAGNYVNSTLAKTESVRLGFDEAVMLDPEGYVSECTGENLFIVRKGRIYTPQGAAILEGITRESLMTIARDLGYSVEEAKVSRDTLYLADELFVCGTAAEVIALREVDFRKVGNGGMGPVTRRIQQVYHAAVRGKLDQYESWLSYVPQVGRRASAG